VNRFLDVSTAPLVSDKRRIRTETSSSAPSALIERVGNSYPGTPDLTVSGRSAQSAHRSTPNHASTNWLHMAMWRASPTGAGSMTGRTAATCGHWDQHAEQA